MKSSFAIRLVSGVNDALSASITLLSPVDEYRKAYETFVERIIELVIYKVLAILSLSIELIVIWKLVVCAARILQSWAFDKTTLI